MAESYQDIMSRLNGGQQPQPPKAANDFASYVRTLLDNPNPQGGMMGDAAGYYADPFRKQNAINQAILDEELLKKQEAEKAAAEAAASSGGGMFSPPPSGGGNYEGPNLTQAQMDYFDYETPFERDVRMNDFMRKMTEGIGVGVLGLPGMLVNQPAPVYSGLNDYSTRSPEAIRQQVEQQRSLQAAVMADEQRKREAAAAEAARVAAVQQAAAQQAAAMQQAGISYNPSAYGGGGGFVNSEGNAPGASFGEVGNRSFSGEVGYDQ
jgi:outer membrane protein TolC